MNSKRVNPSQRPFGRILKGILAAAIIAVIFLAALQPGLKEALKEALNWIAGLGPLGYLLFVLLYVLGCIAFLPGAVLTLGAGFLFGVIKGTLAVSVGSILGATCAFLVGRYLARNWVAQRIAGNRRFRAVDEAVGREGWKIVLLTRLSPVFPFNLLNYAFGLTSVRLKHYFFASWVGMLPGTIMYVYLGSLAGSLAGLGTGQHQRGLAEWVLYGIGLLATIAVTVFVTRLAKKALAERISSPDQTQSSAENQG
jgi:uncharacterized membrane protein YdjX (TVP38/TMEM64 family)